MARSAGLLGHIEVAPCDPDWPRHYAAERAALLRIAGSHLLEFEHIGSTAVPGLKAKPVIDMMGAVRSLTRPARSPWSWRNMAMSRWTPG